MKMRYWIILGVVLFLGLAGSIPSLGYVVEESIWAVGRGVGCLWTGITGGSQFSTPSPAPVCVSTPAPVVIQVPAPAPVIVPDERHLLEDDGVMAGQRAEVGYPVPVENWDWKPEQGMFRNKSTGRWIIPAPEIVADSAQGLWKPFDFYEALHQGEAKTEKIKQAHAGRQDVRLPARSRDHDGMSGLRQQRGQQRR